MMRFLLLAFLLTLPSAAFAQSRVVHDTFREGREEHVKASTETLQNYQEDGAIMLKERAGVEEEVNVEREARRDATEASKKEWIDNWNDAAGTRATNKEEVDQQREDRRTASIAAPSEWWSTDEPEDKEDITANDYDDLSQ